MVLKLIQEELESSCLVEDIKFNFYKNIIKKDIELTVWSHRAVSVFGEFKIFSNFKDELNSFDLLVSYLSSKEINFLDGTILGRASELCSELLFEEIMSGEVKLSSHQLECLSEGYASYLLEVSALYNKNGNDFEAFQKLNHISFNRINGIITTHFRQ